MKFRAISIPVAVLAMTSVLTGAVPSAITPGPLEQIVSIQEAEAASPPCNGFRERPTDSGQRAPILVYVGGPHFANGSADCIVKFGDVGAFVAALQTNLNVCYRQNLRADGIYGTQTRSAVARVQRIIGVPADGVWGRRSTVASKWRVASGCAFLVPGF